MEDKSHLPLEDLLSRNVPPSADFALSDNRYPLENISESGLSSVKNEGEGSGA